MIPAHPQAALPGEAAFRASEGGLVQVEVWRTPDLAKLMRELAAVVGLCSSAAAINKAED